MNQQGWMVLSVAFLMCVMMILTLTQWQSVLMYQKVLSHVWQEQQLLSDLEAVMQDQWQTSGTSVSSRRGEPFGIRVKPHEALACVRYLDKGQLYGVLPVEMQTWLVNKPDHCLTVFWAKKIPLQPCRAQDIRLLTNEKMSWQYGDCVV